MPYLLPADPNVTERACMLVFYPDAPEYRRALLGQIAELSDVWNWEGTRENQALARASWLAAELETLECHDMACLDEIIAILEAIRDKPCCEDVTGFSEGTETPGGGIIWPIPGPDVYPVPDNDTSPGTGDYPITTVTDPDNDGIVTQTDWESYLCGAANYIIDSIIDYLRFVRFQRTFTSSFLGVVRWLQARAAGIIIPGFADDFALWELEDIIDTVIGAFEDVAIADIDLAITQLENIRESLVCLVVGENTAGSAITVVLNAISGEIQNALIASLIGSPATLFASLAWNGLLDTSWDTGCNCAFQYDVTFTFDADAEGWDLNSRASWGGASQDIGMTPRASSTDGIAALSRFDLCAKVPITEQPVQIKRVELDVTERTVLGYFADGKTLQVQAFDADGGQRFLGTITAQGSHSFSAEPAEPADNLVALRLVGFHNGSDTNSTIGIDNVRVAFEDVP